MHIPLEQRIIAIIFSVCLLTLIIQLIRKGKLREEYALVWLGAGLGILVLSVFGRLVPLLAGLFAVAYAPTLILVMGLLFAIVVLISQSVTLSSQANHLRDLAQTVALLEWRLRQLEAVRPNTAEADVKILSAGDSGPSNTPKVDPGGSAVTASEAAQPKQDKVLVIGLDGATFDLIKPWAKQGYLPTFSRLLRQGAHGTLASTIPPMTAPAWTSFATGTNPGQHRLFDWIIPEPEGYRFRPATAVDGMAPTLYTLLSQVGRRVCTLNVPMTFPATPVNGVMVSGMPAPRIQRNISYPPELLDELLAATGDYILYPDPGQAYSEAGVDAFLKRLYRCTELRVRAFDFLWSQERWDFAMLVFNGTDTVSHALWKYMDHDHPLHDPGRAARYGTAIRDFYQLIDRYLGRIVDDLEDDTTLIIMSDHGFGPFHKFIHVNNWLIEKGFMHLRPGLRFRLKDRLFRLGFSPMNIYDILMRLGLGSLKKGVVRGRGRGLLKTLFLSFEDVDWARTAAYSLGNIGQIRLNVKGREPQGCVEPGTDYERIRDEIIAGLQALRDPENGELVVESVYRREEIYSGEHVHEAPDIIFVPRRLEYFGFGEYEFGSHQIIEAVRRGISGTHRLNGIFIAYGAAIRDNVEVDGAGLVDLAPTIMHLMGESVPQHMEGKVLEEIIADSFQPRTRRDPGERWQAPEEQVEAELSEADKETLARRLRDLGYVG